MGPGGRGNFTHQLSHSPGGNFTASRLFPPPAGWRGGSYPTGGKLFTQDNSNYPRGGKLHTRLSHLQIVISTHGNYRLHALPPVWSTPLFHPKFHNFWYTTNVYQSYGLGRTPSPPLTEDFHKKGTFFSRGLPLPIQVRSTDTSVKATSY